MKATIAAIYCRASTNEQTESCDSQLKVCREKAAALGLVVPDEYVFADEGISGSRSDRQEFNRLLSTPIEVLILWKQDRLARDHIDAERAMRLLEHKGVRIVTCDGYDSKEQPLKSRKLLRGVKGLMDQAFLDELAENTYRGQRTRFEAGYFVGGMPYAYRPREIPNMSAAPDAYGRRPRLGVTLDIVEAERKVVVEIFDSTCCGMGRDAIAAELNRRGVPSPGSRYRNGRRRHNRWTGSTIAAILANTIYKGVYYWGKTKALRNPDRDNKKDILKRPKAEWLEPQPHPEWKIVEPEVFAQAHAVLAHRADVRRRSFKAGVRKITRIGGSDRRYWLGGIIVCGCCGQSYQADSRNDYICSNYSVQACSNAVRFKRDQIDDAVFAALREHLLSDAATARARAYVEKRLAERAKELEADVHKAADGAEIRKIDVQIKGVHGLGLDADMETALLAQLQARREATLSRPSGTLGALQSSAERLLAALPQVMAKRVEMISRGLKALTDAKGVTTAREGLRRLLADGTIALSPNLSGDGGLVGIVRFTELDDVSLDIPGMRRKTPYFEADLGAGSAAHATSEAW